MHSLQAIPEPSNNAPPQAPAEDTTHLPMGVSSEQPLGRPGVSNDSAQPEVDGDQLVDHLAVLLVLLIAGALLRLVLGLLGPLQGINEASVVQARQSGSEVLSGDSLNAFPLVDLMAHGIGTTGLPAWVLVALGSLLTLLAVPAAYAIGQTLTGRPAAGIVAAAVVAVHPAVLTAANSHNGSAIALGLVTLALAALCYVEQRGGVAACIGGILLALAGLAAPLCWLVGVLAGPMTFKLAQRSGTAKAAGLGLLVTLIALAPTAAYRTVYLGHDAKSALIEWTVPPTTTNVPAPHDRLLVAMTSTSFQQLGEAMHLPLGDAGRLKVVYNPQPSASVKRDPIADYLADGWMLLNAALAGLAAISAGVLLARRRFAETLLLTVPLVALAFTTLPPSEALRLPMIALVGVLASGLLATRSVPVIDEEKRETKRLAKQAKREERERAKQERELKKHKESLYAFDEPSKPKPKPKPEPETPTPEGILTQHEEDAPQISARPI